MATYNGEQFLGDQLDSLRKQERVCVHLFVYDDLSSDRTVQILQEFQSLPIQIQVGQRNIGPFPSFKHLLINPELDLFEYIAFCDQDDVWEVDKLKLALDALKMDSQTLLYSSRRTILRKKQLKLERRPKMSMNLPKLSLLFENKCYGNTIVFKKSLLKEIATLIHLSGNMPHDWLLARIALMRGNVFLDHESRIQYRIHDRNHSGLRNISKLRNLRVRELPQYNSYFLGEYLNIAEYLNNNEIKTILTKKITLKSIHDSREFPLLRMSKLEDIIFRFSLYFGYIPVLKRTSDERS
jgi:glycosyltransferase involved in cell wall biosynthesis